MSNRVVVTYSNVRQYSTSNSNSFQIEMFFDGVIKITLLKIDALDALAGLSRGTGTPVNYANSDFSSYEFCAGPVRLQAFLSAGTLAIEFDTVVGATYEIQYSDDLIGWNPVTPTIPGTGSVVQWFDNTSTPATSEGARFFRIVTL